MGLDQSISSMSYLTISIEASIFKGKKGRFFHIRANFVGTVSYAETYANGAWTVRKAIVSIRSEVISFIKKNGVNSSNNAMSMHLALRHREVGKLKYIGGIQKCILNPVIFFCRSNKTLLTLNVINSSSLLIKFPQFNLSHSCSCKIKFTLSNFNGVKGLPSKMHLLEAGNLGVKKEHLDIKNTERT